MKELVFFHQLEQLLVSAGWVFLFKTIQTAEKTGIYDSTREYYSLFELIEDDCSYGFTAITISEGTGTLSNSSKEIITIHVRFVFEQDSNCAGNIDKGFTEIVGGMGVNFIVIRPNPQIAGLYRCEDISFTSDITLLEEIGCILSPVKDLIKSNCRGEIWSVPIHKVVPTESAWFRIMVKQLLKEYLELAERPLRE